MNARLKLPELDERPMSVTIPTSAFTLDGFRRWVLSPDYPTRGVKASFLGEEVLIDMAPEFFDTHNTIKAILYSVLQPLVKDDKLGRFVCDSFLYVNDDAGISTEPDAAFFTWESWESRRVWFGPSASGKPNFVLNGPPDMIAEVVSDSTVRKDLHTLMNRYHLAGIPEYWTIDARGDDVIFDIHQHAASEYVPVAPDASGWRRSAVFGRDFRFTRERNRIGVWDYTLHIRSPYGTDA